MPDKNRYQIRRIADNDLEDILNYSIHNWGIKRAKQYIYDLTEAFQKLADAYTIGDDYSHIRPNLYSHSVASHRVFYKPIKAGVNIYRVLHQSMDFERHF